MTPPRLTKATKLAIRKRKSDIKTLQRQGANHVLPIEALDREQRNMIDRLTAAGVKSKLLGKLKKCGAGRCGRLRCSAACWWGNRGHLNDLAVQAIRLLEDIKGDRRFRFVTIIDPLRAVPIGELKTVSVRALMQVIRRAFRECPALEDAIVFGAVEIALEVLPDGRRLWSPHVHLVILTDATDEQLRQAFRPSRQPPDPQEWGKKRWLPVDVSAVHNLPNLLDYISKQRPEKNRSERRNGVLSRVTDRLTLEEAVEYDRWLLRQAPGGLVLLRGLRRVRGVLTVRKA